MTKLEEITTSRFLDLECIDDFQIQATEDAIQATCAQRTKPILEELLNDPEVKGKIRKKNIEMRQNFGFRRLKMLEMIINDVANWHKDAFPDAEKESQIKKLEEELNEYYEKYDDLELADVLICSIALWRRFKCPIGHAVFVYASSIISGDKANHIVAEKMRINRLRKWRIVDGVYRHVESGEK